jgi:hypothetical protein
MLTFPRSPKLHVRNSSPINTLEDMCSQPACNCASLSLSVYFIFLASVMIQMKSALHLAHQNRGAGSITQVLLALGASCIHCLASLIKSKLHSLPCRISSPSLRISISAHHLLQPFLYHTLSCQSYYFSHPVFKHGVIFLITIVQIYTKYCNIPYTHPLSYPKLSVHHNTHLPISQHNTIFQLP